MSRPRVELRDITTDADWAAVMGLRPGPGQETHLNSMPDIRQEAIEDARAMPIRGRSTMPTRARSWASP